MGSRIDVLSTAFRQENEIEAILTIEMCGLPESLLDTIDDVENNYLHIALSDNQSADIGSYFETACGFIEERISEGRAVFVHGRL